MKSNNYTAWAFKITAPGWRPKKSSDIPYLAGIYCFAWNDDTGVFTALFRTRQQARAAAKKRSLIGEAVKVMVTINEV